MSLLMTTVYAQSGTPAMLIDDFSDPALISGLGPQWRKVTDQVMGGVSNATVSHHVENGEGCLRLTGDVKLDNNGGFIQAALDLAADGAAFDASAFTGIRLTARGNDEQYSLHLRTTDNTRPWQSYRVHFTAEPGIGTFSFPFSDFEPHRTEEALDVRKLRRLGVVAIGRRFQADVKICRLEFYR